MQRAMSNSVVIFLLSRLKMMEEPTGQIEAPPIAALLSSLSKDYFKSLS